MTDLLQATDISFSYGRGPVLQGINIFLRASETVALIGPNGSGKSTLIKVLLGHLTAMGTIEWEGKSLNGWRRRELARRIAYLPQTPTYDLEHRVMDVLRLGRAPYWSAFGIESTLDAAVVDRIANQLVLTDLLSRRMDELSGGQRQRVFLGRCLVQEPVAMLLDEPNTYLDIRHQVEMSATLHRLARDNNVGVLMASHDLNLAAATADRLILLSQGVIAAEGTADEVLKPERLRAVYGVKMDRIERANQPPVVVPAITHT